MTIDWMVLAIVAFFIGYAVGHTSGWNSHVRHVWDEEKERANKRYYRDMK